MTAAAEVPVTLDEVRERFIEAETSLNDLLGGLASLRASSDRFDEAQSDLKTSNARLLGVADQISSAAQGVGKSIELIRQAIATLEKSEPGRVLDGLERLGQTVDVANAATRKDIAEIRGTTEAVASQLVAVANSVGEAIETSAAKQSNHITASTGVLADSLEEHSQALNEINTGVRDRSDGIERLLKGQEVAISHAQHAIATTRKYTLMAIAGATIVLILVIMYLPR